MAKKYQFATKSNIQVLIELVKQKFGDYLTDEQIQSAINEAISDVAHVKFEKVDVLPATGETNVIYLVPNSSTEETNVYDEYFWSDADSAFELFGTTQMDLSGYLTEDDFEALSDTEISTMWNSIMNPEIEPVE